MNANTSKVRNMAIDFNGVTNFIYSKFSSEYVLIKLDYSHTINYSALVKVY